MERNWSYTIPEGEHKGEVLWSGRYCCVCAIVACKVGDKIYILANRRATPDFQGFWNMPCGFIECSETGEQAASREVYEETGVFIYPERFNFYSVETDPTVSNNAHVTLYFIAQLKRATLPSVVIDYDECTDATWIPISEIHTYDWAFHHEELIEDIIEENELYCD